LKDATTDPGTIRKWWKAEPNANIGLVTGLHFDVLDVDGPEALAALNEVLPRAEHPDNDETVNGPTVLTPRGWHIYVAVTGSGNTTRLGGLAGVDWRGKGGYVVAPPSVRDDGGTWSWFGDDDPELGPDAPIRPAPGWVLALFERGTQTVMPIATAPLKSADAYGRAALEREVGRVAMAPVGARNDQLNRSAHALGQLAAARRVDIDVAGNALLAAAIRGGLGEAEAEATIRSGLRAGLQSPRKVS